MRILLTSLALVAAVLIGSSETFTGTYDWNQGGKDELRAEFTPSGENSWNVKFKFRFSGRNNTWKGTAEGSLADGGELTGTATNGSRNWIFEASIRNGVMKGVHTEIQRGNEYKTGTFELSR